MEVFFYVPKKEADRVLECGLKLNDWANRLVDIDGVEKRYMAMLLNPKDDLVKYNDDAFTPLKIEVTPSEVLVADGAVYSESHMSRARTLYRKTFIFLDKYIFGLYRMPECLIPSTVPGSSISRMDRRIDVPVLYDRSEELYMQYEIERCREMYDNFLENVLYSYYEHLVSRGLCLRHYTTEGAIAVYESLMDGRIITIRRGKPEGSLKNRDNIIKNIGGVS